MAKLTTYDREELRQRTRKMMCEAAYRQIAPYWDIGKPTAEWIEAAKQLRNEVLKNGGNTSTD